MSITCLLYGKDPKGYADLMKALSIPASRLAKCSRDYPLRLKAWNGMLGPYTIARKKK